MAFFVSPAETEIIEIGVEYLRIEGSSNVHGTTDSITDTFLAS
jgi:hypothetical protein